MDRLWATHSRGIAVIACRAVLFAIAAVPHATLGQTANDNQALEVAEKMSDKWSRTVRIAGPKPDKRIGEWRVWVEEGWLVVERRTDDDKIEWKIVLAKVVGDELPEIIADRDVATFRLSYRDGRYFIRDFLLGEAKTTFGCLRVRRQPKTDEERWPQLTIPLGDGDKHGALAVDHRSEWSLCGQVNDSWVTVTSGPCKKLKQLSADCQVRLFHTDLNVDKSGAGGGTDDYNRLSYDDWFVEDDGELLVANRLESWLLAEELVSRAKDDPALAARLAAKKLRGEPAPELSGDVWLNAERQPTLKALHGKPVLLVLFDLKQPSFLLLLPPLLEFHKTYGAQGLAVIGVYAHAPRHEIAEHLTDEGVKFPVLIDDGKTAEHYGVEYSACVLIDREGRVVSVYKGLLAAPADIEELLEAKNDAGN